MTDSQKTALALWSFIGMLTIPWLFLLAIWLAYGLRPAILTSLGVALAFFLTGSLSLVLMRQPSLWLSGVPLLVGAFYTWLPDLLPSGFDDGVIFAGCALLSAALWFRHDREFGRRLSLPLIGASLYTFVGQFIPGPFDEAIVQGFLVGTPVVRIYRERRALTPSTIDVQGTVPTE